MTQRQTKQLQIALTTAYEQYSAGLCTRAFLKVHNRETSEDLVQDTFLKTWLYLVKGGNISMMKAFLYHILNDLVIDQYRKHKTSSLDNLLEKGFEPNAEYSENLFDILDGKQASGLIKKLPNKYREIIDMRYMQDLSLKEISVITGQTKNTVAVQSHRGLEKLKSLFANAQSMIKGALL